MREHSSQQWYLSRYKGSYQISPWLSAVGSVVIELLWNTHAAGTETCSVYLWQSICYWNTGLSTPLMAGFTQAITCFRTTGVAPPCLKPGTCDIMMPTKHTTTSQPECQNCGCGTITIERFMRYCMIIGNIPIDGLQSALWLSIALKSLPVECTDISNW